MIDTTYYTYYKGEYIQVHPIEDCMKSILARFETNEDTIERLKEENKKLKDEVWKDEELQNMKERLDEMKAKYYRGFPISKQEEIAIREWKKKHEEEVHGLKTSLQKMNAQGASGGRYSYIFYPTAIGYSGVVRCNVCGEEFEFCEIG